MGSFFIRGANAAEFHYKLGLELREDEPLPKRMLEACKAIAVETNGRLQIQGFPSGQLGNASIVAEPGEDGLARLPHLVLRPGQGRRETRRTGRPEGGHGIGFRHITSNRRFMTEPKDMKGFKTSLGIIGAAMLALYLISVQTARKILSREWFNRRDENTRRCIDPDEGTNEYSWHFNRAKDVP